MKNAVCEAYTRRVAFEGTTEECWNWILAQGDQFIDVGKVFIFNEKISC